MTLDLDALEAVARAATPGPWEYRHESPSMNGENCTIRQSGVPGIRMSAHVYGFGTGMIEHIAAFDPPTVLARITRLREAGRLDPRAMHALPLEDLAELIRPAGFFRIKARRLRNLLDWLQGACDYNLAALRDRDLEPLRAELLAINGIGPETADCILCYAAGLPSFVVDAYTRRIFARHGLAPENIGYAELRNLFMRALPPDTAVYNEYHALLVRVAKNWCRKGKTDCTACPLGDFL